jgi:hypothetical protein
VQPKPQAEPPLTSWNDFCRLVLEIIGELSPCPEPTLFVVAANRGMQRFGDGTLDDLRKLLGQCVQELKSRELVEISGQQLVIATTRSAGEEHILDLTVESQPQSVKEKAAEPVGDDILDLTAELELHQAEDLLELTAELEFHPSLRPSKLDKAPREQQQLQKQAPGTGRAKGAAEPTREEIIAAMRRFISDE